MKKSILIPVMVVIGSALITGLVIIPELKEKSVDVMEENANVIEENAKAQSIPTLENGMAKAMKSDCGSTNTILCGKLDKILENQEVIFENQEKIFDLISFWQEYISGMKRP